jgi:hypothetical protein
MSSDDFKIRALLIIEVMGRPPEHLTTALTDIVNRMAAEKDVIIVTKKMNEPIELENQKGLYSNYAEIEVDVKNPMVLSDLMFRYMPAHIEVISPENFYTTNVQYTQILSEITRRLHVYDNIARVLQMEKSIMEKKLAELSPKAETDSKVKEKSPKKVSNKKPAKKK